MLPKIERGRIPTVAYRPPDEHPDRDRSWLDGRWSSGGPGEMDDVFTTHPHASYSINFLYLNLLGSSSPRRFFLFSSYSE